MAGAEEFDKFLQDPNLALFLRHNVDFYQRKWRSMFARAQSIDRMATTSSWNWAAFFIGVSWLLYRKMYLRAIAVFGVLLFPDILGAAIEEDLQALRWLLSLAVSIVMGQFGNAMYFRRSFDQVMAAERRSGDPAEIQARLRKRGGTSWLSGVLGSIALYAIAAVILAALILPRILQYYGAMVPRLAH